MIDPLYLIPLAGIVVLAVFGASRALVSQARPDEWLLQIRDGTLIRGGIGISATRWPQDRIVRFPAAVQRVRFEVEALTKELLPVRIHAFALWSVLPEDPLLAVRRLGLAAQGSAQEQHLLSRAQHRAFQQAFSALCRRHAGSMELASMCREPAPLADAVLTDAVLDLAELGVRVEDVQVLEIRPAAAELLARLSAPVDEALAREAARERDATQRERDRLAREAKERNVLAQIASELAIDEAQEQLEATRHRRAEASLEAEQALALSRAEGEAAVERLRSAVAAEKPPEVLAHELSLLRTRALSETLQAWPIQEARWLGLEGPVQSVERILSGMLSD